MSPTEVSVRNEVLYVTVTHTFCVGTVLVRFLVVPVFHTVRDCCRFNNNTIIIKQSIK